MCQLFDAFVGSVLNYSCKKSGFGKSKVLESAHLKFCKALLKMKYFSCSAGVYGELGRYSLFVSRFAYIVKYWSRIVESDNILIVQLYRSPVDECNKGVNNWATNVRTLLDLYVVFFIIYSYGIT